MRKLICFGTSLLLALPSSAADRTIDLDRVRAAIKSPGSNEGPGCLVGAFENGKQLLSISEGFADVEGRKPLNGKSQIYAGSLSKQFTALAIAQLVLAGRLSLDDDIRKYLPEMPEYDAPITVGMMMHHSSGIKDWLIVARWAGVTDFSRIPKEKGLSLTARQKSTNFTPGTEYAYSNGGYLLLAEIVERVSGKSFRDYTRDNIFNKLGMSDSFFLNGAVPIPNLANGYKVTDGKFVVLNNFPVVSGSGGLITTMNDFAKYEYDIEVGKRIWTEGIRKIMLNPAQYRSGDILRTSPGGMMYGGGLVIGTRRGQSFVQHGGQSETFRNIYLRMPDHKLSVMVFCNRSDAGETIKADNVIEAIKGPIFSAPGRIALGKFRSEELDVTYQVEKVGENILATIVSSSLDGNLPSIMFSPSADGSLRALDATLSFSDGYRKLRLVHPRKSSMEFVRIE